MDFFITGFTVSSRLQSNWGHEVVEAVFDALLDRRSYGLQISVILGLLINRQKFSMPASNQLCPTGS